MLRIQKKKLIYRTLAVNDFLLIQKFIRFKMNFHIFNYLINVETILNILLSNLFFIFKISGCRGRY